MRLNFFKLAQFIGIGMCFLSVTVKAQDLSLLRADIYVQEGRYAKALEIYEKKIQGNLYDPTLLIKAAECLKKLESFDAASLLYEELLQQKFPIPDSIGLSYAQLLQMNDNFKEARIQYLVFLESHPSNIEASRGLSSCDSAIFWLNLPQKQQVLNLKKINSVYSEFAPVAYKSKLVFCSTREQIIIQKKTERSDEPFSDLYVADKQGSGWSNPKKFSTSINTSLHEGPATFSAGFDTIYFSRNGERKSNSHLKLFSSVYKAPLWRQPSDFMLNDSTFSFAHPSISKDGNLFFFSSDIPGGYGGTDLYVCIKADSNWSFPINLGNVINTTENEIFPYYTEEGNLYFSSDGHLGMGGFDIFFSRQQDGEWMQPVHLSPPVNSGADDFSFIPFPAWPYGLFSSNRKGGLGKDDLYYVTPGK